MLLLFFLSVSLFSLAKPEWQQHLDWSIGNRTGPDQLNCPEQYTATYPECIAGGGRACLMEKAIQSAKDNDFNNAMRLSLITQCHNQGAQKAIGAAGKTQVGNYLRKK